MVASASIETGELDLVYVDTQTHRSILKGAAEISQFLFGTPARRREIYYLVERDQIPHFKMGSMICARTSTLDAWISGQERRELH